MTSSDRSGTRRRATAVAALLALAACSRPRGGAGAPAATPVLLDAASAGPALEKRAEAAAKNTPAPGVAVEQAPLLMAPDEGAPVTGTLDAGTAVEVLLVEPGFYGVRVGQAGLGFVPARSVRLGPGAVEGTPVPRPRHEIVPQILPLTPPPGPGGGGTPGTASPAPAASPPPAG